MLYFLVMLRLVVSRIPLSFKLVMPACSESGCDLTGSEGGTPSQSSSVKLQRPFPFKKSHFQDSEANAQDTSLIAGSGVGDIRLTFLIKMIVHSYRAPSPFVGRSGVRHQKLSSLKATPGVPWRAR
jgi:hypothetical protein